MNKRIFAIFLRQIYLLRRTVHRMLALFYWPTVELFVWGFLTIYLNRIGAAEFNFIPILLGALIFWDFFSRAQQSVSVSFLEDIWSRNLGNVFASPIRPSEFLVGLILLSIFQSLISLAFVSILAGILWQMNILQFGFLLLPFFFNLYILAWSFGIVTVSLIMRLGPSVDILAWSLPVLIQPFSAVFYPVSILPQPLQYIAFLLPTTHVFEGMRSVLLGNIFRWESLWLAFALNLLYFLISLFFFYRSFHAIREQGLLQRYTD